MKKFILAILFLSMFLCNVVGSARISVDPVVQYKLNDDTATSVVVDAQVGHDGAARTDAGEINTDTINDTGKINGALRFNGSTQYVRIPDHADFDITTTLTVCVWAKNDNAAIPSGPEGITAKYDTGSNNREWELYTDTTEKIKCIISDDGTIQSLVETDVAVSVESWHFYAFTFDASSGAASPIIYVDGSAPAQTETGAASTTINNEVTPVTIGAIFTNAGTPTTVNHWDGLIDNVMIFDYALTANQINYLYNNGVGRETIDAAQDHRSRYGGSVEYRVWRRGRYR